MKVYYDNEVDVLYIQLSDQSPDGVIEIEGNINIDTTDDGKITGIEIIKASQKLDIDTILSYTVELNQNILGKKIAKQVRAVDVWTIVYYDCKQWQTNNA